jgi:hypothetical protein
LRNFALFISVLFHPLMMCTYGCLLLFFGIPNTVYDCLTGFETKWRISLIVFTFSFLLPVITLYFLFKLKRIPTLTLSSQSDRTFPYILTTLFYFGLFYLMFDINIWAVVKLAILGAGSAILITALINLKFKISAHMVGIGGLLGILISIANIIKFDMTPFYILIILLAGLLGYARLKLEEHEPYQIYTGFCLGLSVQLILFFTLQKITIT